MRTLSFQSTHDSEVCGHLMIDHSQLLSTPVGALQTMCDDGKLVLGDPADDEGNIYHNKNGAKTIVGKYVIDEGQPQIAEGLTNIVIALD